MKITKIIFAVKYVGLIRLSSENMIASLEDMLVQNYDRLTGSGV